MELTNQNPEEKENTERSQELPDQDFHPKIDNAPATQKNIFTAGEMDMEQEISIKPDNPRISHDNMESGFEADRKLSGDDMPSSFHQTGENNNGEDKDGRKGPPANPLDGLDGVEKADEENDSSEF